MISQTGAWFEEPQLCNSVKNDGNGAIGTDSHVDLLSTEEARCLGDYNTEFDKIEPVVRVLIHIHTIVAAILCVVCYWRR